MGPFDQNARQASKLSGQAIYDWILRRFSPKAGMRFDRWGDARRLAAVPGLERVDDLVAVMRTTDIDEREVFLITEVEVEPRRHQLKRLGVYALLLSIEESRGPGPEGEPPVGTCLLTLTGRREPDTLTLTLPSAPAELTLKPLIVNSASRTRPWC